MKLSDHPTVRAYSDGKIDLPSPPAVLQSEQLKRVALDAGADDIGLVDLQRGPMEEYRQDLLDVMPDTRSVMVLVFRVNQGHLRSLHHSVTDHELKVAWSEANHISRRIVDQLRRMGIRAVNMPAGFPYEANRWPGKIWLTCDKAFAAEGGLGRMGTNRLVLHPKFGAAVVFGSVLVAADCDHYDRPIGFNPCIECGLCISVCPVGAVKKTDGFDFTACYTHNYRERLGGFQNWVEQLADSKGHADYRRRVSDSETISMWQHLAIGAQTRCDRCMAVCPAGEASIGEFLDDRKAYVEKYLKRFKALPETIYVVKGSDAEQHARGSDAGKTVKTVSNGIRPTSAAVFLESLPLIFQPGQSEGLDATYHFTFTGQEQIQATVRISARTIEVSSGLDGRPDLHLTADSLAWVRFLAKELNLVAGLATRRIKIKGPPRLMTAFARCFPM